MAAERLKALITVGCLLAAPALTSGANIGYFWHVTDFHYDYTYWTDQLSCNDDVTNPGAFGDYWCDSPWRLVNDTIQAMTHIRPDVDFLIWTGDTVAHISNSHLSVNINMDIVQDLTTVLASAFPNKTVYATYGNHDYYPNNQYPATITSIIYDRTADMWKNWIVEPDQLDNFRKGGYYTRLTDSGLRIVALNTNLYYTSDLQTPGHPDPAGQFKWFRTTMQQAKSSGEKVIVIAHIPPGIHTPRSIAWFHPEFIHPFNSILTDFAHIIVAMHYGHDHYDGFKVYYDDQGRAAAPLFVAPSVTPWRYKLPTGEIGPPHNPSIRLVTFDRDTGRHLDIQQYYLDLPASNRPRPGVKQVANFTLLYSFTQHYGVHDLTALSLEELTSRMATPQEEHLLDDYYKYITAGADQEGAAKVCDKDCKARILCGFKHYTMTDFNSCVTQLCDDTCPHGGGIVGR